ncbi:MAG: hypothetical protein AAF799_10765 [Myxococcota bacterium]
MSEATIQRCLIVVSVVAALGLSGAALSMTSASDSRTASSAKTPPIRRAKLVTAGGERHQPRRVASARDVRAPAPTVADEKHRELEASRTKDQPVPAALDHEGPRPESEVELEATQSDAELELPGAEKAHQARRLASALETRADNVRERIEQAEADGDAEEAARQQRILVRLDTRAATLTQHAEAFDQQDEDGTEP